MSTAKLVSVPDMPDIANRLLSEAQATLDWVGMSNVHQPLKVKDGEQTREVHANIQVYVNLADPLAKGIHMSRLYLLLDEHAATRPLTASGLENATGLRAGIASRPKH
jgi:GTP cyclohydrolase I